MKGKKTGGRAKGVPNKITATVKDQIALVAENLGGHERMLKWVRLDDKNETIFWKDIYPKLLPLTLSGDPENPLTAITKIVLAPMKPDADSKG